MVDMLVVSSQEEYPGKLWSAIALLHCEMDLAPPSLTLTMRNFASFLPCIKASYELELEMKR